MAGRHSSSFRGSLAQEHSPQTTAAKTTGTVCCSFSVLWPVGNGSMVLPAVCAFGLKTQVFCGDWDDDEFVDMGQLRNTFQGIPAKIIVHTMGAVEPRSISKDQVWIKMRTVQGQAESSHVNDRLHHPHH